MYDDTRSTESGRVSGPGPTLPLDDAERKVRAIGPYRLLELVGQGGMGEVWCAEQTHPMRRKVAIKLVKAGMDSREVINRFEAERQALAMMDHPCIAKVFDAGTTPNGRPYFVMEYVAGLPLNVYCDRHRLRTGERLRLFQRVCQGVQHAHQKSVLHRDLKPRNVLVTDQDGEAQPKIIDFGLAKALASPLTDGAMHTTLGQIVGTPEYMSPEQTEDSGRDVDTRADVYSLGVILYELLVGSLPFEAEELRASGYAGIRKRLLEEDPPKPSSRIEARGERSMEVAQSRGTSPRRLHGRLAGDLDWIVMRALEKDRNHRYGSPQQLADDIERHLDSQPVMAGPPSPGYRVRKFVRRHCMGVTVTMAATLLLLAFAVTSTYQARSTARARDKAQFEAARSQAINDFLEVMLAAADPWSRGDRDVTIAQALATALGRVDEAFDDQPLLAADLRATIGKTYFGLGKLPLAHEQVRQALDTKLELLGPDHPDLSAAWLTLARIRLQNQEFEAAVAAAREARRIAELADRSPRPELLDVMEVLARSLVAARSFTAADSVLDDFDRMARSLPEAARTRLGRVAIIRADLLADHDEDLAAVDSLLTAAIAYMRSSDPQSPDLPLALNNLAVNHMLRGELDQARVVYEESLDAHRAVFGEDHPEYASALENLGGVAYRQGRYDEALSLLDQVRDIRDRNLGPDHIDVVRTLANRGAIAVGSGRHEEALASFREAVPRILALHGEDHPESATILRNQSIALRSLGRYAEADAGLRRVIAIHTRLHDPGHGQVGRTRFQLAVSLMAQDRWDEAEAEMRLAFEILLRDLGPDHPWVRRVATKQVEIYEALDRPEDAQRCRSYLDR